MRNFIVLYTRREIQYNQLLGIKAKHEHCDVKFSEGSCSLNWTSARLRNR